MSAATDAHPLQSETASVATDVSDTPGSPIIKDFQDQDDLDNPANGGASSSAQMDELDYDESADEDEPLIRQPQPKRANVAAGAARRLFPGFFTQRAASPSLSEADTADSTTEADLLLPSPSETSSIRSAMARKRWGTFLTRLLAYVGFGVFFILGWKLVFLPRTTLRRDLARLRHKQTSLADLERHLFSIPDTDSVRQWSNYYTSGVHLAGTNLSQAQWTAEKFTEYGIKTEIVPYYTYLNYPKDHSLKLLGVNETIKYVASLEEDPLPEDPTSMNADRVPTFHGYSANGNVTAQYVYVNYGRQADFDLLEQNGVSVTGRIVIARYGGLFRGLIVKGAQERGATGVLMYTDPGDDGNVTTYNKYKAYPDGPARNPSSVQRGSVEFLSVAPGDPTTPGWASKEFAERVDPYNTIPSIPSLPVSYKDMIPILRELNGMGFNPNDFGEDWRGGLREFDYSVGPSTNSINMYNLQEYKTTPIWNTIGRIDGVIKDEVIIIGNHRDAWIVGGAGDPNSGSAVLIELARALGELKKAGWKPLRSIILASWDGEEYALLGSTEWGEDLAKYLGAKAMAYLNVDVAVSGPNFNAAASPLLNTILKDVVKRVPHPSGGYVYDHWFADSNAHISTLGSGSDYTVFMDHLGIPSIDFGFGGGANDAVYQYHSNYDSFAWMDKFGDPTWEFHTTMVKIWGLLLLQLSEQEVIQFDIGEYARSLSTYFERIKSKINDIAEENAELKVDWTEGGFYDCSGVASSQGHDSLVQECRYRTSADVGDGVDLPDFELGWWYIASSLRNCTDALDMLVQAANKFDVKSSQVEKEYLTDYPWFKSYKKMRTYVQIQGLNSQYMKFERKFLYEKGLDERDWYKHIVFAPGYWTGYAGATFPGLDEALDARNITNAKRWLDIITEAVHQAAALVEVY